MKIKFKKRFHYPNKDIFKYCRDNVEELVEYAPNINNITVKKKEKIDKNQIKIYSIWEAEAPIPNILKFLVKPDMLRWKCYEVWDENDFSVKFKIEPFYFASNISCGGEYFYKEDKKGETTLDYTCEFKVNFSFLPGVPKFLVHGLGEIVEKFIGKYLEPNLKQSFEALDKIIEEKL